MRKAYVMAGEVYANLTVLRLAGVDVRGNVLVMARCQCGTERLVRYSDLRSKHIQSCGSGCRPITKSGPRPYARKFK